MPVEKGKGWLELLRLTNEYERRARLLPALASFLPLMPLSLGLGSSLGQWVQIVLGTTSLFAVGGVALANLASAFGNRLQKKLWPEWPRDCPTNVKLLPWNRDISSQQRAQWYRQIKQATGIDLELAAETRDHEEIRASVNDAVVRLRNSFRRGKQRSRHEQESIRYGYARNLAGMWPVWLSFSFLSCFGNWAIYLVEGGPILWSLVASGVAVGLPFIAFGILPDFVRIRSEYYTEVFFRLLEEEVPLGE